MSILTEFAVDGGVCMYGVYAGVKDDSSHLQWSQSCHEDPQRSQTFATIYSLVQHKSPPQSWEDAIIKPLTARQTSEETGAISAIQGACQPAHCPVKVAIHLVMVHPRRINPPRWVSFVCVRVCAPSSFSMGAPSAKKLWERGGREGGCGASDDVGLQEASESRWRTESPFAP